MKTIVLKDTVGLSLAWTNFTFSAQICYTSSDAIVSQNSSIHSKKIYEGTGSNPGSSVSVLKTWSSNTQCEINITTEIQFVNYWTIILQTASATFYNAIILTITGTPIHAYGIVNACENTVTITFPVESGVAYNTVKG